MESFSPVDLTMALIPKPAIMAVTNGNTKSNAVILLAVLLAAGILAILYFAAYQKKWESGREQPKVK